MPNIQQYMKTNGNERVEMIPEAPPINNTTRYQVRKRYPSDGITQKRGLPNEARSVSRDKAWCLDSQETAELDTRRI